MHLQVNTCFDDFALLGEGAAPIAPCAETAPFDPIEVEKACKTCEDTTDTKAFKCGIRIIADPVEVPCHCYPPNNKISYLGRKIDIFPIDGFSSGTTHVKEVQKMVLPENTGYDWQWRDYISDNGGRGRNHNTYNNKYGHIGLPGAADRANATKVDCATSYCAFAMKHRLPTTDIGMHANVVGVRGRSVILIPGNDTTTLEEFTTAINDYVTSAGCPVKKAVHCLDPADSTKFIKQNQIESTATTDRFPDGNGRVQ